MAVYETRKILRPCSRNTGESGRLHGIINLKKYGFYYVKLLFANALILKPAIVKKRVLSRTIQKSRIYDMPYSYSMCHINLMSETLTCSILVSYVLY